MDQDFAKPDAGGHGDVRGGAERLVGHAQGSRRQQFGAAAAKLDAGTNELIKAVVSDYETSEGRAAVQDALRKRLANAKPAEVVQRSVADLRDVAAILNAKAPGDAAAFKEWLRALSHKVAEAASEGGFLGFGGVQVTDAEKATLADIAKALSTA